MAPPPVTINNTAIERTETFKLLGVVLSNKLDWSDHCDRVPAYYWAHSACTSWYWLRRAGVPDHDIPRIYISTVRLAFNWNTYAAPVSLTSLAQEQSERLESVQKRALRV